MPSPSSTTSIAVERARLQMAFFALPVSLTLSSLLAGVIALVLYMQTGKTAPLWWYGVFLAVSATRGVLYRRFRQLDLAQIDPALWRRRFGVTTLAAGACWGSVSLHLPDDAVLQLLLAFALAGTVASAATSLSAERAAAVAFIVTSIAPLAVRLLLNASQAGVAMGAMVLLFMGMVIASALRLHERVTDMIVAQLDAETQRRELESARQQMQRLNDRMHIATQTAKAGVWELNVATHSLECDEQVYRMYGIPADSAASSYQRWRSRVHPQDLGRVEATLRDALASSHEFTTEFRVVWPDGTERSIKTSCLIQRDAQGAATQVIGMNWDITDLRRVDRMKSEFVSIVSHELRTPLTSICAALGLLQGGALGEIAARGQQLLQLATRNAERLAVLIDDLLDMEKIESGKLRFELVRQPLQPLLEQALATNAAFAAMQSVRLSLQSHTVCEVEVDANRLLQVVTNLLSNAAKFSPRDGVVTLSVHEFSTRVRVAIHDDGPGISAQFQAQIFGKFCQDDSSDTRPKGGSGLGLSISRAIVEQMHGTISFTSAAGQGTTFYFDLPLHLDTPGATYDSTTVALKT